MTITRRGMFGLIPALGAMTAIPSVADEKPVDTVKPIIFEHVCDGGKVNRSAEQIESQNEYYQEHFGVDYPWGCGTRFQWHFGVPPYCPNCGWAYEMTLEALKRYKRVQG